MWVGDGRDSPCRPRRVRRTACEVRRRRQQVPVGRNGRRAIAPKGGAAMVITSRSGLSGCTPGKVIESFHIPEGLEETVLPILGSSLTNYSPAEGGSRGIWYSPCSIGGRYFATTISEEYCVSARVLPGPEDADWEEFARVDVENVVDVIFTSATSEASIRATRTISQPGFLVEYRPGTDQEYRGYYYEVFSAMRSRVAENTSW